MAHDVSRSVSRRTVLRGLGSAGALAAVGPWLGAGRAWAAEAPLGNQGWTGGPGFVEADRGASQLAIARNGSPADLVDAALDALGGIGRFVESGQKVLVKPNIGWDRAPEMAANTNPEVVARVVELCLQAGAKQVTVMDRTCNDARRCYTNSGIEAAAEAAGARVIHPDDNRTSKIDLGGVVLREWEVYDEVLDADVRINLPIAKVHGIAGLTMGMKNWMGCVGGRRSQMHQEMQQSVVDLAAWFKPQLTILDAYRVMISNGPQGGRQDDVRLARVLAAGTDVVAVDTFGASLFGKVQGDLEGLELGAKRGLGSYKLNEVPLREVELGA